MQTPLESLRDIHLPDPISWWPPAWGWWVVLAILLASITTLLIYLFIRYKNNFYRREALSQLQKINYLIKENKFFDYLFACNALLKRIAIHAYPNQSIAKLTESQWKEFLTSKVTISEEYQQALEILTIDIYRPSIDFPAMDKIRFIVSHWIKNHPAL